MRPWRRDINTVLGAMDEQIEWHLAEHHPLWPGKAFLPEIYDGFRDGKCVRWQSYADTWQIARVLNFTPELDGSVT